MMRCRWKEMVVYYELTGYNRAKIGEVREVGKKQYGGGEE
jgi:hypothetical protein